ncbi:MAG: excinuclease ABC subunit UvrB [Candidatus Paceibacterota bacterium]
MEKFKLHSEYKPAGDQPKAIEELSQGVSDSLDHQTLLGVTGSGKTFTMANVIANAGMPTLVIAHNKTLAAQLAQEYREFFPENAVHYFVSYYDYYQPEAYMPSSDTYIEKEAQINAEIDRLRHASTQALLTRSDVIIVASVSCIYGLGSPEEYEKVHKRVEMGMEITRRQLINSFVDIYFERTNADLEPGRFRAIGTTVEVMPVNERVIYRIELVGDRIERIQKVDATTRSIISEEQVFYLFPAQHFVTPKDEKERAVKQIKDELEEQLAKFKRQGKLLEAERLKRRTNYDIAMIREIGYCQGIENYSRHFDGRTAGEAPHTLLSYFPHDDQGNPQFLTIIDESHVTVPQIGGMYGGDRSRKETLVEHGFRLPSAKDNRPLTFDEFEQTVGQRVYTSATPSAYEYEHSKKVAEQIIRPTGLVDPKIEVHSVTETETQQSQINDFIDRAEKAIAKGGRVIATTLTKRMAEDLTEYLKERGVETQYVHSDIKTIERIDILTAFRRGEFDCLVGVNLLREGLDLPEVTFIGILDADKEGFLRSETSLIQIIGRAARNVEGAVVLYADKMTKAMNSAISETDRRRKIQLAYNKKHNITPQTIKKQIHDITDQMRSEHDKVVDRELLIDQQSDKTLKQLIKEKEKQMNSAVKILDFETAAILRDEIKKLTEKMQNENK